jgi:hypothetical protein
MGFFFAAERASSAAYEQTPRVSHEPRISGTERINGHCVHTRAIDMRDKDNFER